MCFRLIANQAKFLATKQIGAHEIASYLRMGESLHLQLGVNPFPLIRRRNKTSPLSFIGGIFIDKRCNPNIIGTFFECFLI